MNIDKLGETHPSCESWSRNPGKKPLRGAQTEDKVDAFVVQSLLSVYTVYHTSVSECDNMGSMLNIHNSNCFKRPTKCPAPQLKCSTTLSIDFYLLNDWPSLVNVH